MKPRPRPWLRSHLVELALFLVVVLVASAGIVWARWAAPDEPLERIAIGAAQPDDARIRAITCERTLPDAVDAAEEEAEEEAAAPPLGRVQSSEVLACPDAFDQVVVDYVGEVVGDVLRRDGGAWLLVNDDAYALESGPLAAHDAHDGANQGLAVWLPTEFLDLVDEPGNASRRGDVIEVVGRIHRADPLDGGGLTLRASSAELVRDAEPAGAAINRPQALVAVLMTLAAFAVVAWGHRNGRLSVPGLRTRRRLSKRR
ncbi:hypothetical protein [Salsipaludibacter albus]|uniref:hypothetical protein n=1 Tax=Salsipaludibacter albus TaxID=2849650 RepID=UPI001EE4AB5D|nr:hypothetical protein [Salsipaludibacter albus]MBY5162585.1 hypothetical protein [Salsipaludibacter albus]